MKKFDLLIFDADRTLFDFDKAEKMAIKKICYDINIEYNEEILENYKMINHKFWDGFEKGNITQESIKTERFREFFEYLNVNENFTIYGDRYLDYLAEGNYLLKNAYSVLEKLYGNYTLVLLTNGLSKVQFPRFNKSSIKKFFKTMVVSEDVGVQKPDKRIFDIIFKKIGNVDLNRTLMIGDSLTSDIQGGINAKITTCWYNIDKKDNKENIRADYTIEELPELFEILGE